jgi:phage baseplate assembly protein W
MTTYFGFSTAQDLKKYTLTDFELAKQDLINYFNIRKGEKLMQPRFGTVIWDLLFDPLTPEIQSTIQADVLRIVGYDPRITATNVTVTQQTQGFLIQLVLQYVPGDQTATINLNFDANSKTLTTN